MKVAFELIKQSVEFTAHCPCGIAAIETLFFSPPIQPPSPNTTCTPQNHSYRLATSPTQQLRMHIHPKAAIPPQQHQPLVFHSLTPFPRTRKCKGTHNPPRASHRILLVTLSAGERRGRMIRASKQTTHIPTHPLRFASASVRSTACEHWGVYRCAQRRENESKRK